MIDTRVAVTVRPMRLGDMPQVTLIDRLCFPTPWPASSYRYELTESRNSSMFVLALPESNDPHNGRGLLSWLNQLRFGPPNGGRVIGFSGFWFLVDEVHISTIGVHPDWRGMHLGELLLFVMLCRSVRLGARLTTLEVRASNVVAQNLYRKYGFEIVGRRKSYYRDNREDALLMSVDSGGGAYVSRLRQLGAALSNQLDVIDEWA